MCLWKEGVEGMLDIEILEGFETDDYKSWCGTIAASG